ncbi:MAG: LacI family transcriptional regulator [Firmicutes bacterium]|nr:LacI family transcriptional regulator [Bacillota bacterium]
MATINDIAKAAGVSKATVSNVFTKKKPVGQEIKQRVLEVCKELNYYPNRMASSLVTKRTNIIGLLLENSKEKFKHFYGDLINGVMTSAAKCGYKVLLDACTDDYEQVHTTLIARSDPIDGSIIHAPIIEDDRILEMIDKHIPFVLIGRPSDEIDEGIFYIDVNNVDLACKTTTHLLQLGHREIGFLNSRPNMTITFDRLKGYIEALGAYGIPFNPSLVYNSDNTAATGKVTCSELLKNNPQVTAMITCSDDVAVGVYDVLEKKGYRIPDDISVIALGGDDYSGMLEPRLTTVLIDYRKMGKLAVELLLKRIKKEPVDEKRIIVEAKTFKGESCTVCPKK